MSFALQAFKTLLRSTRKIRNGNLIELKPPDLVTLARFPDMGRTALHPANERGRNPMLPFVRYDAINDVEEFLYLDLESIFFRDLSRDGMRERLAEVDTAAGEFPPVPFVLCFGAAFGEEYPPFPVKDDRTHAHADIVNALLHIIS
jgi:hypothetical protein